MYRSEPESPKNILLVKILESGLTRELVWNSVLTSREFVLELTRNPNGWIVSQLDKRQIPELKYYRVRDIFHVADFVGKDMPMRSVTFVPSQDDGK